MGNSTQNDISHIKIVVDESGSMAGFRDVVIRVVDALVAKLDDLSTTLSQETRVSLYTFHDKAECLFYDMDVRRRPSIAGHYRPRNMTALIDATLLSIEDQRMTPQKYGNHAFLTYVITDGHQNAGRERNPEVLRAKLESLRENETVACLVPGAEHVFVAKRMGFPAGNVAVWDATSSQGVERAAETIYQATATYMTSRSQTGLRATTNLFSMDSTRVNDATVKSNLTPLSPDDYKLIPVTPPKGEQAKGKHGMWEIKEFAEHSGWAYAAGETGYYQFVYIKGVKPSEKVTPGKKIIIVEKSTGRAYSGPEARTLLGLSHDKTDRVKQQHNEKYDVYISSDSNNRHLPTGTKLLLWKPVPLKQRK